MSAVKPFAVQAVYAPVRTPSMTAHATVCAHLAVPIVPVAQSQTMTIQDAYPARVATAIVLAHAPPVADVTRTSAIAIPDRATAGTVRANSTSL
jgi:hypothetical protein